MSFFCKTKRSHARKAMCAALALAAVSIVTAGAADAKTDSLFGRLNDQNAQAGAAAELDGPAQTLPASKNPRPFRQTKRIFCDDNNVCTFLLHKVKKNKILELQNISCFSSAITGGAILTKSADPDELTTSIVAVIPAINPGNSATNGAGPYYFNSGERVIILMSGDPGGLGVCSIYGTLSNKV